MGNQRTLETCLGAYEIGQAVSENARGCEGEVFRCVRRQDGCEFAVKIVDRNENEHPKCEVLALENLDHPNVVRMFDWHENDESIFIIQELARGGDLFERIVDTGCIPESECLLIFRQLLHAVRYLHDQGVVHCDIKPENILFASPRHDLVKLADFGSSVPASADSGFTRDPDVVTTVAYASPELLLGGTITAATDLWSLGAVLYTMLAGFPPFGQHPTHTPHRVLQARPAFPSPTFDPVSPAAVDLISLLLLRDPAHRLIPAVALRHPWLSSSSPPPPSSAAAAAAAEPSELSKPSPAGHAAPPNRPDPYPAKPPRADDHVRIPPVVVVAAAAAAAARRRPPRGGGRACRSAAAAAAAAKDPNNCQGLLEPPPRA